MKKLLFFLLLIPALINAQLPEIFPNGGSIACAVVHDGPCPGYSAEFATNRTSDALIINGTFKTDSGWKFYAPIAEKITIGKIPAVVYKPSDYDAAKKYPVWVFFHGLGEMAKDKPELDRLIANGNHAALLAAAEKYKFIVVAPQLVQSFNGWTPGWTVSYTDPVLEFVVNNSFTDLSHIVVTGLSLGGGGTWVAATGSYAQHISAAIPICGTPQYDQDFSLIAKYNTPVWAFVAKNDAAYYYAQINTISAINKFSPTPEPISTIYNTGGHGIWGTVYSDQAVYAWALSQSNGAPVITPPAPVPVDEVLSTYKVIIYKSGKVEVVKQ